MGLGADLPGERVWRGFWRADTGHAPVTPVGGRGIGLPSVPALREMTMSDLSAPIIDLLRKRGPLSLSDIVDATKAPRERVRYALWLAKQSGRVEVDGQRSHARWRSRDTETDHHEPTRLVAPQPVAALPLPGGAWSIPPPPALSDEARSSAPVVALLAERNTLIESVSAKVSKIDKALVAYAGS